MNAAAIAEHYVSAYGLHLVPLPPRSKKTTEPGWGLPEKLLSTPERARDYYLAKPNDNIGVALGPSRLCSLDIDDAEAFDSICAEFGWSLAQLTAAHPTVQGQAPGVRVMFRVPEGATLPYHVLAWPKRDGKGRFTVFEVRAAEEQQRQDVLPPSIHPDTGRPYTWITPPEDVQGFSEPPCWLLALWNNWAALKPQLEAVCPWAPRRQPKTPTRPRVQHGGESVIDAYNAAHSIEATLPRYGYTEQGRRWLSPHSTTGLAGVNLIGDNRAFIHHASDPLCSTESGQPVAPFDLFRYYEHGNDVHAAVKAAAAELGMRSKPAKPACRTDYETGEIVPANENGSPTRFTFLNVGDMVENLKPIDWLVKGYVERDSMAVIYGEPGHGKSFVAIDIACCVATGTDWHGRAVKPGAVFYIAGEGHNGLARRFRAWSEARGVGLAGAPLFISNRSAALTDKASAADVSATVKEMVSSCGVTPTLIVVDTLARNFGAADENSAADMGSFVMNLDNNLRHPWKATVAIVHHSGKDASRGARGSTALRGAVDAEYEIARDESGTVRMQPHKMKDAENPEPLAFRLDGIELPLLDEDGNPVFGAALQPVDYVEPPRAGKVGRGKNQTKALEILAQLERENRARLIDAGYSPDGARVGLDQWRDRLAQDAGIDDRQTFYKLKESLRNAGKIRIEAGDIELLEF